MVRIGIIGSAGLSGRELLYWLQHHPKVSIEILTSDKYLGMRVSELFPEFSKNSLVFEANTTDVSGCDLVFLAIPNQASLNMVPKLLQQGIRVIDLSGAYRLSDTSVFSKFYRLKHTESDLLEEAAFGLPEYFKDKIASARLVANPGCFPTGALLGMLPLNDLLHDIDIAPVIDAKSGVSGAGGRTEDDTTKFISVNENFKAYKIFSHQHQPEIQQYLTELSPYNKERNGEIIFTPHLLPMNRGILSTIYIRFNRAVAHE